MAKAKKKSSVLGFVLLGIIVLGLVMAIVGILIDYVNLTTSAVIVGGKTEGLTLAEMTENYKDIAKDKLPELFAGMRLFAVLAVILSGVTAVAAILARIFRVKLFRFLVAILGLLSLICGIVAIATAYGFCDKRMIDAGLASVTYAPAAGAWLLAVFTVLGGGAAIFDGLRK